METEIVDNKRMVQSPEYLISQAIEKGASVETMEKLLAMRTQLKQEWAKEQYYIAMAQLQAEMPIIEKTKAGGKTNTGVVAYYYAPLESIVAQTKELISKNGFSYSIKTLMNEDKGEVQGVKVFCETRHKDGHSETTDVYMPLSTKTSVMSAPQVVAATLSFAKRYTFCNAFGILTCDEDNDASIAGIKATIKQPQSKSSARAETELPYAEIVTTVGKITKKGLDFRILGEGDIVYITRQETFATLAKSAKEAGLQVKIKHQENIIVDISLLEPETVNQTQDDFLNGLEADAVAEGLKSAV